MVPQSHLSGIESYGYVCTFTIQCASIAPQWYRKRYGWEKGPKNRPRLNRTLVVQKVGTRRGAYLQQCAASIAPQWYRKVLPEAVPVVISPEPQSHLSGIESVQTKINNLGGVEGLNRTLVVQKGNLCGISMFYAPGLNRTLVVQKGYSAFEIRGDDEEPQSHLSGIER